MEASNFNLFWLLNFNRVENKLQSIETRFTVLESNIQKLSEKLEFRSTTLENEMDQNEMWESLLETRWETESKGTNTYESFDVTIAITA